MKTNLLLGALLLALPLSMVAQDDDMYFMPSKKAEQEAAQKRAEDVHKRTAARATIRSERQVVVGGDDFDYHVGQLRDVDEYNRRQHYITVVCDGDTTIMTEDELTGLYNGQSDTLKQEPIEEEEYGYSNRLVRFHGGVASPYYWDYYYSWAYDPWFYDPWYRDPWLYGWSYGFHRPGWGIGFHYGYYDPWYHGYYYGPGGWYYTSVGPHYNHHSVAGAQGAYYGGKRERTSGNALTAARGAGRSRSTLGSYERGYSARRSVSDGNLSNSRVRQTTPNSRTEAASRTRTTVRTEAPTRSTQQNTYTPSRSTTVNSNSGGGFGGGFGGRVGESFGGGAGRGGGGGGSSVGRTR